MFGPLLHPLCIKLEVKDNKDQSEKVPITCRYKIRIV